MKKQEFLSKLRKKLSVLEESEIDDIIEEYDGYIEEKIAKGCSEEEAVKSMGDLNELARDLLSAYKVKNPSDKKDTFTNLADSFVQVFDEIVDVFSHKSFQDILRFVIEIVFIFLIIAICKIPFSLIKEIGYGIFSSFGNNTYPVYVLKYIWNLILEFSYLIFAILLFIKIFESRYLHDSSYFKKEEIEKPQSLKSDKKMKEEKKEKIVIEKEKKQKNGIGIIDCLTTVCLYFIKFITLFILAGVVFYLMGMAAALGVSIYFIIRGVFYFGIYFIVFALFGLGIVAFLLLFNFIFNRKSKLGSLLIITLICLSFLGAGAGICVVEFANTEIIYTDTYEEKKEEVLEVEMQDDLVLWRGHADTIEVDDTLENKIKIVYTYSGKYYSISINTNTYKDNTYKVLHPTYHIDTFHYSHDFFENIIHDLKDKKIQIQNFTDVDITIYASSKVKKQLLENEKAYDKKHDYDPDLEEFCESLINHGYTLPNYCERYLKYEDM